MNVIKSQVMQSVNIERASIRFKKYNIALPVLKAKRNLPEFDTTLSNFFISHIYEFLILRSKT